MSMDKKDVPLVARAAIDLVVDSMMKTVKRRRKENMKEG